MKDRKHWEPLGKHKGTPRVTPEEEEVNEKTQTQSAEAPQTTAGVTPFATPPPPGYLSRRVARLMPTVGTAHSNDAQLYAGPLYGTGTQQPVGTITLPLGGGVFTIAIASGIIRIKIYNTVTAVTAVGITLWDGTTPGTGNSEALAGFSGSLTPASATTGSANIEIHFQSDLNVTSMVFVITGGTGGSADIDVGATSA
jgi:hypothetical protein